MSNLSSGASQGSAGWCRSDPSVSAETSAGTGFICQEDLRILDHELNFITENDPDHDIASGDHVINDSLFDESSINENAEADAEAVEAETKATEPNLQSTSTQYLRKIVDAFALEVVATTSYSPSPLYEHEVFVWIPDLLTPMNLKCYCNNKSSFQLFTMHLLNKGFNDNPIARCIRQKPKDYFLLTCRYLCNKNRRSNPGCGMSWQGTDPHIIGQLARHWQEAFPAFLSACGGIDKSLMAELRCTSATRFGAGPYSALVDEMQRRHHAELELMYLACAHSHGFSGSQIPLFSAFNDASLFAGAPPSTQYMRAMFTDWFAAFRIYLECDLASTSGTRLAGDHTFWIMKHMGGLKGEPLHTALYSVVNEWEQVRAQSFCLTKSLSFVQGMYERLREGLRAHGHPPTRVIYCDQPQVEQDFHEKIMPSITENVNHITSFSDLAPFEIDGGIQSIYCNDPIYIQSTCSEILQSYENAESQAMLIAVSLRTAQKVYILKVSGFTSSSNVVPSLKAILTNRSIIKLGSRIHSTLFHIARALSLYDLEKILCGPHPPILDLGSYAKLKGITSDTVTPLDILAGSVLHKFYEMPQASANYPWSASLSLDDSHIVELVREMHCIWEVYQTLTRRDSTGLPLTDHQARTPGQLITFVISQKPVAEGTIVMHKGSIDIPMNDSGQTKHINLTASRSLIEITKVLLPLQLHRLHVVTMSMLRSRSETSPLPPSSPFGPGFITPARLPSRPDSTSSESLDELRADRSFIDSLSADSNESMDDQTDEGPSGIEHEDQSGSATDILNEAIDHGQNILRIIEQSNDPNAIASSRVLDDAFHFMDRLLRCLPTNHPAYNEFAHRFSEAIFLRDASDEAAVQAVIEKKGGSWNFMKRRHSSAINKRIHRLIPDRDTLNTHVSTCFTSFKDIRWLTKGKSIPFFSDSANEMAERLLETIRRGFLSDPKGLSLYFEMGHDHDGLFLYRCMRGTNSVEGGLHMPLRCFFGASLASTEGAEALLVNLIYRRNKTVGHHNRTGSVYKGHFDIWLLDEIAELAAELSVKPSFCPPPMLTTRIATSETFGINPISSELAQQYGITTLPPVNVSGVPHHRDLPVHSLTCLSTKPTNQYRYLQLRQRVLFPVTPVHTHAEYWKFKSEANDKKFCKQGALASNHSRSAHEFWKDIDFLKMARDWNSDVEKQDPLILNSNDRLYSKLPQHLELHAKKVAKWNTSQAMLFDEVNAEALRPLLEMLEGSNRVQARVLNAISLRLEKDLSVDSSITVNQHSFNSMATLREGQLSDAEYVRDSDTAVDESHFLPLPNNLPSHEINPPSPENLHSNLDSERQPWQQAVLTFTAAEPGLSQATLAVQVPVVPIRNSKAQSKRCAAWMFYDCPRRLECPGSGGRVRCRCGHDTTKIPTGKVWLSEAQLAKRREAQNK
ncbi:hypothetical protein GYMLUDRAFT_1021476 [Collybiopsis luxurians FD-317 M1]|uniref:Uncharacterized protein n=1 Tax=Collybiopsis luxurians FD-317 M1 TaxID=944289 RepID=A0A0D0CAE5_9AGAR|nr:hypothetical protein GYMLUDRAFT_1021476 [Collybiopsis luxurians FD-317 M1]